MSRPSTTSIRSPHGGANAPGNVVLACARCNRLKGDLLPTEFFARYPWAGLNFIAHARAVHRALKRCAKRAVSLAYARAEATQQASAYASVLLVDRRRYDSPIAVGLSIATVGSRRFQCVLSRRRARASTSCGVESARHELVRRVAVQTANSESRRPSRS